MRNHEVLEAGLLLDSRGELREPGWSRSLLQEYRRSMIKAPKFRVKEWDYYLVVNDGFAAAFTISDDGYIGLQSVSLLVFGGQPWEHTETVLNAFPMGKLHLPEDSSSGVTRYSDKRLQMSFEAKDRKRHITCHFENFMDGKALDADIVLAQPPMDTTDFGTLDWGRGVWTYDNTWFWGSGNADVDGHSFGWNIGYGFGDTSAASENILFWDGKAHKLDDVIFHIPESGYMDTWKFSSSDGRFEMTFEPVLDRAACLDYKIIVSDQHQVFGHLSGKAVLDDGREIIIRDVMCFAEKVHNKY